VKNALAVVHQLKSDLAELRARSPFRGIPNQTELQLWMQRAVRRLEEEVQPGIGRMLVPKQTWVRGIDEAQFMAEVESALEAIERDILRNPNEYSEEAVEAAHLQAGAAAARREREAKRKVRGQRLHEYGLAMAPKLAYLLPLIPFYFLVDNKEALLDFVRAILK
jgi:hypothetical protein